MASDHPLNTEKELLTLEERFWKADAAFYQQNLTADALMVFPDPVGVMEKDTTVASIAGAARWVSVSMADVRTLDLAPGAVLLTYRATARREDDSSNYTARVCSVYVDRGAGWKLTYHQQAPLQSPGAEAS